MAEDRIPSARLIDLINRPPVTYPSWVEPVILPKGGLLVFGGHSKIGKSFQALELTRALSTGSDLFGYRQFTSQESKVLYLEREIGEYGLQARSTRIFRDEDLGRIADNVWYVSQDPDLNIDTYSGVMRIADHVDRIGANVLVLDPISHMFSVDENDATAMSKVFNNVEQLRKQFRHLGLSVVMAHHFGKPPTGKFQDTYDHLSFHNFRGSSKFFSAPDTLLTSWRAEELNLPWESWRLKCRWVCRQGESPPEMYLTVNKNNDLRVRWERNALENKKPQEPAVLKPLVKFSPASFTAEVRR